MYCKNNGGILIVCEDCQYSLFYKYYNKINLKYNLKYLKKIIIINSIFINQK
jgi:hypothetical protein